jgi:hypothetical protein
MNSFISKIKYASSNLIDTANQKIPSLPSLPYQFTLSESKLNLAIKLTLPAGGDLKSVVLMLQPGFADTVAGSWAGGKALELMMDKLADQLAISSAVFQPQELALTIDRSAAKA